MEEIGDISTLNNLYWMYDSSVIPIKSIIYKLSMRLALLTSKEIKTESVILKSSGVQTLGFLLCSNPGRIQFHSKPSAECIKVAKTGCLTSTPFKRS